MNEMAARGEVFLRPRIDRALQRAGDTHTWPDVCARLADGRAQFWQSDDGRGAILTELLIYPRLRVVNYWIGAGAIESCLSLVPTVEEWARRNGCTRAIGMGRPGFARLLGDTGVTVAGVAYRKELLP